MNKLAEKVKNNIWATIIIAILGTGIVGHAFDWWNLSITREDDYIKQYVSCQREISDLREEFSAMRLRFSILELAAAEMPFPFWIKDQDGNILHLSRAYVTQILTPMGIDLMEVLHTKGEALGGAAFVEEMLANDREVLKTGKVMDFRETIPNFKSGTTYKFPIRSRYGEKKGSGGIWISDDLLK